MALSILLSSDDEAMLAELASSSGQSRERYAARLLRRAIEDAADLKLAKEASARVKSGEDPLLSREEVDALFRESTKRKF